MKERLPELRSREENRDQQGADRANYCVEKSGEREGGMSTLKLLNSLVELYDAVQEGENFC